MFHVTRRSGPLVFGWNEAVLSLSPLAQSRDFGINVAIKFKFRLVEFGHGLRVVDLLTASLLVTQRLAPGLEEAFPQPARMFLDVGKAFSRITQHRHFQKR
jgi:hypothetical protein